MLCYWPCCPWNMSEFLFFCLEPSICLTQHLTFLHFSRSSYFNYYLILSLDRQHIWGKLFFFFVQKVPVECRKQAAVDTEGTGSLRCQRGETNPSSAVRSPLRCGPPRTWHLPVTISNICFYLFAPFYWRELCLGNAGDQFPSEETDSGTKTGGMRRTEHPYAADTHNNHTKEKNSGLC